MRVMPRAGLRSAVDARELHAALDTSAPFVEWLRAITTDPRWVPGVDFVVTKDAPNDRHRTGRVGAALSVRVALYCGIDLRRAPLPSVTKAPRFHSLGAA